MRNLFIFPTLCALIAFSIIWYFLGTAALFLVAILSILETTLSFDNAVVNAKVLERMNPVWQHRFLTWGILVAVFGTRFVLPIMIVSTALWMSPVTVTTLVFTNPAEYGHLLEQVHGSITAFGAVFLLMVSLKYFFNQTKEIHWIRVVEKHLVKWGRIEAIEIACALSALLCVSFFTPFDQIQVLVAGIVGLLLFIFMESISSSASVEGEHMAATGISLFFYLEMLDTAFSLDGVVGAFALTSNLLVIAVGLGIGALFVRSLTLYLVEKKTLSELVYLEHGAHWAIFGLAFSMFVGLLIHVPEIVTGLIGLCFVTLAYRSSLKTLVS